MPRFGTYLELKIVDHLLYKKVQFEFRTQLSGGFKALLGDDKANFLLFLLPNIILRLLDYGTRQKLAIDIAQAIQLENRGLKVVDLFADDLRTQFASTMEAALKGEEFNG